MELAWISAIASSITALSVLILWWQIKLDHERSRREKSIELMTLWNEAQFKGVPSRQASVKLVEIFNEPSCAKLWNAEEVSIDVEHLHLVEQCNASLGGKYKLSKNEEKVIMPASMSSEIRPLISHYLNSVEVVATSWRHHTVDREIIEDEFVFIFSKSKNPFPFSSFRKITGVFPSTDELIRHFDEIENPRKNKRKIDRLTIWST